MHVFTFKKNLKKCDGRINIWHNGTYPAYNICYYNNKGNIHKIDGPAFYNNGVDEDEWWIDGHLCYDKEHFKEQIKKYLKNPDEYNGF